MSKMSDIVIQVQDEIRLGILGFGKIAEKYNVSLHFVNSVWEQMCEEEL